VLPSKSKGYIGLGPKITRAGDIVCVVFGYYNPVVLRPQEGYYQLIGICYLHGTMQGEAVDMMKRGELQSEMLELR